MSEKYTKVSDKSQPLKIAIFIAFFVAAYFGYQNIMAVLKGGSVGGVSFDAASYGSVSSSTVACSITTSTLITATTTGRTSLWAANTSGTLAWVCQGATCAKNTGRPLVPVATTTRGDSFFEQDGAYYGPYSCSSDGTSPTAINYEQSQ